MSNVSKYSLFFVFFSVLWFANGMFDFFSTTNWNLFYHHQADSASLVWHDLILKDQYPEEDKNFLQALEPQLITKSKNKDLDAHSSSWRYLSHIGLQSIILLPIYSLGTKVLFKGDEYSYWKSNRLSQIPVAFITALSLSLFLTFLAIEFEIFPVLLMGLWMVFSNVWITIFARNIYYMSWSWFLPFLCTAYFLYFNKKNSWLMYLLVFLTIALKSTFGYEYLTTIMVMTTLPIFYFAITRSWTRSEFISVFWKISLTCFLGIIVPLLIHAYLLGDNIKHIQNKLYFYTMSPILDTNTKGSLLPYFFNTAGISSFVFGVLTSISIILLRKTKLNIVIGVGIEISPKQYLALTVVTILSFLGAMSYHLIFMQHSLIHTHMNLVLWFLPFWFFMIMLVLYKPPSPKEFLSEIKNIGK